MMKKILSLTYVIFKNKIKVKKNSQDTNVKDKKKITSTRAVCC